MNKLGPELQTYHPLSHLLYMMDNSSEITVSAPGKIIFHGEHAVVYGKPAVAASLSLRSSLTLKARKDKMLSLQFPAINIDKTFSLLLLNDALQGLLNTVSLDEPGPASEVVIEALKKFAADENIDSESKEILGIVTFLYLYYAILSGLPGISATVSSDIPIGAGFGSSGAFSTTLAAAFLELSGHISSERSSDTTAQWSTRDKDLINKWAFVGEQVIHGQPSGVDNTVSTLGGGIKFMKNEKTPIIPILNMPTLSIMLVNTKVSRSTKTLVARFRERYLEYQDVCEPLLESMSSIANRSLDLLLRLSETPDDYSFSALGALMDMNHQLLNAMGVGHPALDQVVSMATRYGLHAKLTGAGGGGCAFVLVPPDTDISKIECLKREMEALGFEVWTDATVGVHGVCRQYVHA